MTNDSIVDPPQTGQTVDEYDWHVWKKDRQGKKPDEWVGFFKDSGTALAWVKKQSEWMVINNVPPETSKRRRTNDDGKVAYGNPWDKHHVPTSERPSGELLASYSPPKRKAKKATPPVVETEEMKALREEGKKRLAQHEKDEAKDIEDGTTQSV